MKYLKVTEADKQYLKEFGAWIQENFGAKPTQDETVFEVSDTFDCDQYHGTEEHSPNAPTFEEEFADVVAWLRSYNGTFPFYLSLKAQLEKNGKLSPKQVDAVVRAMERDHAKAEAQANRTYSIAPGAVIVVGKWLAKEIAIKAGYPRAHHVLEVVEVLGETDRAYQLKVKLSAQRTSRCGVCGLTLTNPESVRDGIGPICAEKSELPSRDLVALAEKFKLMCLVDVVTWVPKASIKERSNQNET